MLDQGPTTYQKSAGARASGSAGGGRSPCRPSFVVPAARGPGYLRVSRVRSLLFFATCFVVAGEALAAGAGAPAAPIPPADPIGLGNWLLNFACVFGIAYMGVKTFVAFRRQPPLERELGEMASRFAAADHSHSDLLTSDAIEKQRKDCIKERLSLRRDVTENTEKVQRQLDGLRTDFATGLASLDKAAEARASGLHKRLDPISNATAANTRSIQNHLDDHRAKGT